MKSHGRKIKDSSSSFGLSVKTLPPLYRSVYSRRSIGIGGAGITEIRRWDGLADAELRPALYPGRTHYPTARLTRKYSGQRREVGFSLASRCLYHASGEAQRMTFLDFEGVGCRMQRALSWFPVNKLESAVKSAGSWVYEGAKGADSFGGDFFF